MLSLSIGRRDFFLARSTYLNFFDLLLCGWTAFHRARDGKVIAWSFASFRSCLLEMPAGKWSIEWNVPEWTYYGCYAMFAIYLRAAINAISVAWTKYVGFGGFCRRGQRSGFTIKVLNHNQTAHLGCDFNTLRFSDWKMWSACLIYKQIFHYFLLPNKRLLAVDKWKIE